MLRRRLVVGLLTLAALLLLTPAIPVHAAPSRGDEVILGDDLTLQEGEHVSGDVVIIGGDLTMRAGSRVEGGVTVLGGRVEANGTVEGDLVAVGGDVNLGSQVHIAGDLIALGGRLRRAAGAQTGDVVTGLAFGDLRAWRGLRLPLFSFNTGSRPISAVWAGLITLMSALIMAALGAAIGTFWPAQTSQVAETILTAPLPSLGVGCLLYPLAASLTIVILITICLAPIAPVVILLVVAASLFGWVALGRLLGRWLARSTGWQGATRLAMTGLGVFLLTIVAAIAGAIPCLGPVLVLGAVSVGAGAVTLSRFGTSRPASPPAGPPAKA